MRRMTTQKQKKLNEKYRVALHSGTFKYFKTGNDGELINPDSHVVILRKLDKLR